MPTDPRSDAPNRAETPVKRRSALRRAEIAAVATCASIWLLFTIPVVSRSALFPLDLPRVFDIGTHLPQWINWILSPYNGSGRYFPVYWFYWCLQVKWFGFDARPYLALQSTWFAIAAVLSALLVYRASRSRLAALLTFAGIYLSSPIAENLSTVGKAEPLSYLFIICLLTIFQRNRFTGSRAILAGVSCAVLFSLAIWTKETALVLMGFAASGAVMATGIRKIGWWQSHPPATRPWILLLMALGLGLAISRLPYLLCEPTQTGAYYTDFELTKALIADNLIYYLTQLPDVLITGLLAVFLLALALRRRIRGLAPSREEEAGNFVFMASICAMGWGYWIPMQFWRWPMAYYMLLPAIAFKVSLVYAIWLQIHDHALVARAPRRLLLAALTLSTAYGAAFVYYVTASQLTYSRIFTEALASVRQFHSGQQRLIVESYPFFAEQIGGLQSLINQEALSIRVSGIGELIDPVVLNPAMMKLLNVTDEAVEANVSNAPSRDDLLLTFTGSALGHFSLRGVTPYFMPDSFMKRERMIDLEEIAGDQVRMYAPFVHEWDHLPRFGEVWLGYKLYRVREEMPRFLWSGRFPDGWVGPHSTLRVNPNFGKPVTLSISAPAYVLPVQVTIRQDGQIVRVVDLKDTNVQVIELAPTPRASTQITLDIPKTFSGRDVALNRDRRKLSARVTLIDPLPSNP